MKKIEIKLKECCLTCEHFDPSGCTGLAPSVFCCGEPDRVIACGHMAVCKEYLELHPPRCCEVEKREIIPSRKGDQQGGAEAQTRPCWWYGKPAKFHMWSYGVPFHHFSHAGLPKECTIGILEDEDGRIVNARPEDIHFVDTVVE